MKITKGERSKYWKVRYFKTIGALWLVLSLTITTIIITVILWLVPTHNKFIIIAPLLSMPITAIFYFINKVDKTEPNIEIDVELIMKDSDLEDVWERSERWNAYVLNTLGIKEYLNEIIMDQQQGYKYYKIVNKSGKHLLSLNVSMRWKNIQTERTKNKIAICTRLIVDLFPHKEIILLVSNDIFANVKYFSIQKYGRVDKNEL